MTAGTQVQLYNWRAVAAPELLEDPVVSGASPLLGQKLLCQKLLHPLFDLPEVAMETITGKWLLTLIGRWLWLVLIFLQHL